MTVVATGSTDIPRIQSIAGEDEKDIPARP
jgi:hypothetical protein